MIGNFYKISISIIGTLIVVAGNIEQELIDEQIYVTESQEHIRTVRQSIPGTTCICVPPGSCNTTPSNPTNPSDGSGNIDIRIVTNNGTAIVNPTTMPTPTACGYGLVSCCRTGPYRCGERYPPSPNSGVAGPGQSAYGAYPWQAALLITPGDVYLGGGALIDNRHILTTAHKIFNIPLTTIKIRLGEWNAGGNNEPIPPQDYTVVRIFTHPSFNSTNLINDIAILRLSTIVNLGTTPTVGTVCLTLGSFVGSTCWVAGWGKDDFNGNYQAIQKQVDLPVLSADQCQTQLRSTRLGVSFVFNAQSFICAGGTAGKDSCTGDGGSPLVCPTVDNRWVVVGLVAWGIGCGTNSVPGVYVNVASFITWIQQSVQTP